MCNICVRHQLDPLVIHKRPLAAQTPQDPFAGLPTPPPAAPYQAGPLPGVPNNGMPTQQGQVGHSSTQTVGGITRVNGTADPRVLWEDGVFAIIYARDFPANTGMGRSATRKSITEAINQQVDPARVTAPGAGSMNDFIKVVLSELLARPVAGGPPAKLPISPGGFRGRPAPKQMIASGYGSAPKGMVIPDAHFPHVCGMCGGWYYQGSGEHPSPDGKCPSQAPTAGSKKAKR